MKPCRKPGLSQYHVESVAANVRITIMCLRMAHNQSDVSASTLLMSTQKCNPTSVPKVVHAKLLGVPTPAPVENQRMLTR